MVSRISTLSVFQTAINDIGRSQAELARLTRQVSSGREAANFVEMSGKIGRVQDLERTLARTQGYVDNNNLVISRLNQIETQLTSLEDIATDLISNIITRRSGTVEDSFDLGSFARDQLALVTDALNGQSEGRFLFAGGRTDTPPVGDIINNSNLGSSNQPTGTYYNGDSTIQQVRATDQLTLQYGVTADNEAFQKLIAALHLAVEGHGFDSDTTLETAQTLAEEALDAITVIKSSVNNDIVTLTRVNNLHATLQEELSVVLQDEAGINFEDVAIQLSLNETILLATFQNFARISNLRLVDVLR